MSDVAHAIAALAASGRAVDSGASSRFLLDEADGVWLVEEGWLDLFAVETAGGQPIGPLRFLWSATAPALVLGLAAGPGDRPFGLMAVGAVGTRVRRVPLAALQDLARQPDTVRSAGALVEAFVKDACAAIGHTFHAHVQYELSRGAAATLADGQSASSAEDVVWVSHADGQSRFAGTEGAELSGSDGPVPMGPGLWVVAYGGPVRLTAEDTAAAFEAGRVWAGLRRFRDLLTLWMRQHALSVEATEHARLIRKAETEAEMRERGLAGLASVLADAREHVAAAGGDALLEACREVGGAARIEFRPPAAWEVEGKVRDPLGSICRASRVRSRRVALRAQWWRADHGPLLGFVTEGLRPVALVPRGPRRYELFDPGEARRVTVDATVAAALDPFAVEFYRPSPDTPIRLADLGRMILAEARGDVARLLLSALAGGLLGVAVPIATGKIFSEIIPTAVPANILPLLAALAGATIGTTLFDLMKAFALVRIEGRLHSSLQASIIDRVLALPIPFFRAYAVGNLGQRALAVNAARELLNGAAVTAILTGVFSVFNLVLLFYYSVTLAFVAIGALLVTMALTATLAAMAIRVERQRQAASGAISGLLFQIIGGIAKLRVAGAEGRSFAVWMQQFRRQRELAFTGGVYQSAVAVFNDILPMLGSLALFATAGTLAANRSAMDTGTFVAFYAAFGTFFATGVAMSNTLVNLLNLVPIIERAAPILESSLEGGAAKPDPGELTGRIEVSHVSFRYAPDAPLALHDVSFEARPGEFVAIVGSSGSGKSTLLRLLLGFEPPETGAVYYDGQDIGVVDISAVRAQIGVVLQTSRLLAGNVFNNIVGASPLTLDDAWEAAEKAGLADDIRSFPMGMHTVISDSGSTFSGGQRQRLLIARALVRRPRLILFDEATSALDNRTQEVVSRSLERLQATRIVIAHRLSTIRNADRLYIMDHGQIVQHGTYDDLVNVPGRFADLIARQVV